MTLREEVIKNAGVLEEGKFKNFLITTLIAAAAVAAAVKGVPAGKAVYNQYKYASEQSVGTKYQKADIAANIDIANWRNGIKVYTNYTVASHQPILNIDIKMADYVKESIDGKKERTDIAKDIQTIIISQLNAYLDSIKRNSSKLEKYLSKGTYIEDTKPLKVQLDFKATEKELAEIDKAAKEAGSKEDAAAEFDWLSRIVGIDISGEIARKLGINREYVDTFINGSSAAFKR